MSPIIPVISNPEIRQVANLARQIWNEHFVRIIGQPQVDYMLKNIQSESAISAQIAAGQQYFLLRNNHTASGYLSLINDIEKHRMMLSKLYVLAAERGHGHGKQLLNFAATQAKENHCQSLWLTVNRFNHSSIDWYRYQGFNVTDEVQKDIGGGFIMDDYVMELTL